MMKRILLCIFSMTAFSWSSAQITLDACLRDAKANYPVARQYDLIREASRYSIENLSKTFLPQLTIGGKMTYQSETVTLPFRIPGSDFDGLPKDQYQITAEISQNLWDGGNTHYRKQRTQAETQEQLAQTYISMYALKERVENVFFGILLTEAQLKQNESLQHRLSDNLSMVTACRNNGIANDADVDAVKVEALNAQQTHCDLAETRQAYIRMLSLLTGKEIPANANFSRPKIPENSDLSPILRPELRQYEAQKKTLLAKQRGLQAEYMPHFGLFVQGALGNPGLNWLKDKFSTYYMAGIRLTWNFGSLYTLKNNRRILGYHSRQIDVNKETFLINTRMEMEKQEGNIAALRKQMQTDNEIIRLRANIRRSAEARTANGTLTVTEMLREVISENIAEQTKALHEIQLLNALYRQKHLQGQENLSE